MDDDQLTLTRIQQEIEELRVLTEETRDMVRDLRRNARLAFWARMFLWALVIILPLLLIKPILNTLVPATDGQGGSGLFGLPSQTDLKKAIDTYQNI